MDDRHKIFDHLSFRTQLFLVENKHLAVMLFTEMLQ